MSWFDEKQRKRVIFSSKFGVKFKVYTGEGAPVREGWGSRGSPFN